MFKGLGTALVTPFDPHRKIDWAALRVLVQQQLAGGADFLVPCGTTGESPTLSHEEHLEVFAVVTELADEHNIPVLAGTGSNSTAEAVELTEAAKCIGASGVLVVSPYFNKPMNQGLLEYYREVATVGLPVILYDIPGRTGKGVPTEVILELMEEKTVAGMKWASGDFDQLMDLLAMRKDGFVVLSGDDNLTYPLMALGGDGVISVLSNLAPERMSKFIRSMRRGLWEEARKLHYELLPLMRAMFMEVNPVPVKTALAFTQPDIFGENFRSPMCRMEADTIKKLQAIIGITRDRS